MDIGQGLFGTGEKYRPKDCNGDELMRCFVMFFLTICVIASCYEPKEGCIDSYASNYDVSADDMCEDCCKYPNLSLSVYDHYNNEDISSSDTLYNIYGERFRLDALMYVLSDIHLNDSLRVRERKTYGSIDVSNDIFIAGTSTFKNTVGTMIVKDSITSLRIVQGLPTPVIEASVPSTDALYPYVPKSRESSGSMIYARLLAGDQFNDTIEIQGIAPRNEQNIALDTLLLRGEAIDLKIQADYTTLFYDKTLPKSSEERASYLDGTTIVFTKR